MTHCPLAPHHTQAVRSNTEVRLRVLFAVAPGKENLVRTLIDSALDEGVLLGPDGATTHWVVHSSQRVGVLPEETAHAQRLISS